MLIYNYSIKSHLNTLKQVIVLHSPIYFRPLKPKLEVENSAKFVVNPVK